MNEIESAAIHTLAYADIFDQALTVDELERYLIQYHLSTNHLQHLKHPLIIKKNTTFALVNRDALIQAKSSQEKISQEKIHHIQNWQFVFRFIPWIKFVGVTGSVAAKSPRPNDDIDLLIITDVNRLWLSRLLLTVALNITMKRRKPHADPQKVNNKFCLNMWISLDGLEEKNQDLYTANELARVIPIINRHHTYQKYLAANNWASRYLPNAFSQENVAPNLPFKLPVIDYILSAINNITEKLLKKIMKQPTNETIESNRLAFHPHDYRTEILSKYKQRLRELNLTTPDLNN